jgi:hypothetical protein
MFFVWCALPKLCFTTITLDPSLYFTISFLSSPIHHSLLSYPIISYSSFPPHEFGIVCNGVGISEVILTFIFFFITFYVCFLLFLSLFQNGSLSLKRHIYSSDEYCVALSNYSIETFDLFNPTFRICPKDDFSSMKHFIYTRAFPICCSISNFFLLLTFSVYALLPELRRPTFGKITMIFIVALFLAYLVICNESI